MPPTGNVRPPRVLGISLKLYFDPQRTLDWARQIADLARDHPAIAEGSARLFVLPSFTALAQVGQILAGSAVEFGAQDLFWADRGPYTGAVSGTDLRALGCRYAEIGHLERRLHFGEDHEVAHRKFVAALRNDLVPVVCVGERDRAPASAAAREVAGQLDQIMGDSTPPDEAAEVIVAYEPEWAIGSDHHAGPERIRSVCHELRRHIADSAWAGRARVIYGGSAQPGLLPALAGDVDGLFLGRFAHDVEAVSLVLDETRTAV